MLTMTLLLTNNVLCIAGLAGASNATKAGCAGLLCTLMLLFASTDHKEDYSAIKDIVYSFFILSVLLLWAVKK